MLYCIYIVFILNVDSYFKNFVDFNYSKINLLCHV